VVHQYGTNFPHKLDWDGTFESTCDLCGEAVAWGSTEASLAWHEANHRCGLGGSAPQIPQLLWAGAALSFSSPILNGKRPVRGGKVRSDF